MEPVDSTVFTSQIDYHPTLSVSTSLTIGTRGAGRDLYLSGYPTTLGILDHCSIRCTPRKIGGHDSCFECIQQSLLPMAAFVK